jgi:hypothetical protein
LSTEVGIGHEELDRRHRVASLVVFGGVALTLALMAIALSGALAGALRPNPLTSAWLMIIVVFFGAGAIVLRRTRTNRMRLSAIASLRGPAGLIRSLEKTTLFVSLIGYAVAVVGCVGSLMTPEPTNSRNFMLWVGAIALVIFYSAYPRRAAWRRLAESDRGTAAGV